MALISCLVFKGYNAFQHRQYYNFNFQRALPVNSALVYEPPVCRIDLTADSDDDEMISGGALDTERGQVPRAVASFEQQREQSPPQRFRRLSNDYEPLLSETIDLGLEEASTPATGVSNTVVPATEPAEDIVTTESTESSLMVPGTSPQPRLPPEEESSSDMEDDPMCNYE